MGLPDCAGNRDYECTAAGAAGHRLAVALQEIHRERILEHVCNRLRISIVGRHSDPLLTVASGCVRAT
jgi:hypothetical protein